MNALNLPDIGFGVGLRTTHFPYLMQNDPLVDWFEIISENFMDDFGYARHVLEKIASERPVVMHGVSLSIGSTEPLNHDYLIKLKELADFIQPQWISDHLCWTGINHANTHDLLPMPFTKESLAHTTARIQQVQDFLQRPLILENPSSYLEFQASTMPEWDFLSELVKQSGCGLLLDVNNVYVSAFNHGFDAAFYIDQLPHDHIVQMHIAGPTHCGEYLIDTHDKPVPTQVWELYQQAQALTGGTATLLEWDADIPDYPDLVSELFKAKSVLMGKIPDCPLQSDDTEQNVSNPLDVQRVINHA